MQATVILAKCKNSKESFGIRAEQQGSKWVFTWAFKISDKVSANEGYNTTNVAGVISLDADYPGYPHFKAMGFSQCGKCKKQFAIEVTQKRLPPLIADIMPIPETQNHLTILKVELFRNQKQHKSLHK
ncbi:MAG TPA: hypothetical protein PK563_11960 [Tenuifilaceae bacterium]|nr:hypothetical protein [Tenuifilaceae bacterium]